MDELLTTRLLPPPLRPTLVARERLLAEVRAGLAHTLTLVVAPAGAGKTTALAQALAEAPGAEHDDASRSNAQSFAVAWVSLDEGDDDPARFWRYVLGALERAAPGRWSRAESALQSTGGDPAEPLATALLNEAANLEGTITLVLDDYHLISAPAIHAGITLLAEHAPAQLRLAITTRARPPLPLASLAVRGRLAEIGPADLRFTVEEAGLLFSQALGLPLAAPTVATLVERTEGWGAGLIMAAIAARGRDDPEGFVASFGGASPVALDYVAGEILARLPPELRDFLLATAPLPRLSAELCDAVLARVGGSGHPARPSSAAMLERVAAANLFLVPLDNEGRWFRYHHLFAEVLQAYQERADPAALKAARARAAAWFAARGAYAEAIPLALAAEAWPQAAAFVAEVGRATLLRSEVATLRGWLAALPPTVVHADARLALLDAWVRVLSSDLDGADALAADAPAATPELRAEVEVLRTTVGILRGHISGHAPAPDLPHQSPFLRTMAELNRGFLAQYTGDVAAALAAFEAVAHAGAAGGGALLAFIATCQAAEVELLRGRPREAAARYQAALDAHGPGPQAAFAETALVGLGAAAYELGEFERAARLIQAGLARRSVLGEIAAIDGLQRLASIAVMDGDVVAAFTHMGAATSVAHALRVPAFQVQVAATRARLGARIGDRHGAAAWLASPEARPGPADPPLVAETLALARADVLLGLGRPAEALAEASAVTGPAQAGGRGRHAAEAHALCAAASLALGRPDEARAALTTARAIARPAGLTAIFYELGLPPGPAVPPGPAIPPGPAVPPAMPVAPAIPDDPDALTEREVQVLRLVAAGLGNREIAARLVVTPATVKKHINRIFAKLGASSRTQALVRARQRGVRV